MSAVVSTQPSKNLVKAAGRMLSPSKIYENFDALAQQKLVGGEFGLALMEAVGTPRVTITKLKDEAATGSFYWTRMLQFESAALGDADRTLELMKAEATSAAKTKRPRLLVAYDGEGTAIHNTIYCTPMRSI